MPGSEEAVAFLFTDIEGSTRLWEEHPEEMRAALARHDGLLRQAIEAHQGAVFKTIGDAFCAVFAETPHAVSAALEAQIALNGLPAEGSLPLRVRMAIHTGEAERREDDYFGRTRNRIALLVAAGHGGQILLSEAAQHEAIRSLPPAAALKSLGEHRLRDLGRAESVFQLEHPDLRAAFPALRSLNSPDLPNNLPNQLTSFIGREKEIEDVKTLLGKTRLLTLTGSGGAGKTRLSLQVAAEALDQYPEGVWLVELAALQDPAMVAQAVAATLGVRETAGQTIRQTLVEALVSRRLLLILDNCEHLIEACAQLADALQRSCPQVRILASSREALGVAGERPYRVASLTSPDPRQALSVETLGQFEAVRLFVERARAVRPHFTILPTQVASLASLCHRLDGIPLAIELAAARARSLSIEEIDSRLDNRFRLLTGGSKTALPRQQTLRALIDWSYDMLNAQEKLFLQRLSVFAGGWTLEAAESVCTGDDIELWEALDLLTSLTDKSLLVAEQEGEHARYRMLETIHQYAWDRLEESGDAERMRIRHRDYFLQFAEQTAESVSSVGQAATLEHFAQEQDNLLTALRGGRTEAEGDHVALQIAVAMSRFWYVRGHYWEGRAWLQKLLDAEPQAPEALRNKAQQDLLILISEQGDYALAWERGEEKLAQERALGDPERIAWTLNFLGTMARDRNDFTVARTLLTESLTLRREQGDREGVAHALGNLGRVAFALEDYAAADALYEENRTLALELQDDRMLA